MRVRRSGGLFFNAAQADYYHKSSKKDFKESMEMETFRREGLYIREKLAKLNLNITKQVLGFMRRSSFYCGILVNSLLEDPVKGN